MAPIAKTPCHSADVRDKYGGLALPGPPGPREVGMWPQSRTGGAEQSTIVFEMSRTIIGRRRCARSPPSSIS
ncbi:hypothetical protein J6590_086254 [Homalodisca vitripennis]|nr:hypothetical protein J6590_086254 [Homalodisca vitripennis]